MTPARPRPARPGGRCGRSAGTCVAGVTVTAYLVPQVMAYADLAGVPPAAGLWAAVGAMTVYAAIGTSPRLSVGPEATTALMTAAALGTAGAAVAADRAVALAFLVALVCFAGRLLGLARLAELLSRPVLVGYMTGIALVMMITQLAKLTAAPIPDGKSPLAELGWFLQHLDTVEGATLAVGLVTLTAMLLASWRWPRAPVALLGMVGASVAVAALDLQDHGVAVIGHIPSGLPQPGLPDLGLAGVVALVPAALAVAFVGFSDNILTARAFATRQGDRIDAPRELIALGGANLGAAFLSGMPVSSSGSRTAIVRRRRRQDPRGRAGHRGGDRGRGAAARAGASRRSPRRRSARSWCTPRCGSSTSASSGGSRPSGAASS